MDTKTVQRFFTLIAVIACGEVATAQVEPAPAVGGKEYITEPNTNALGLPVVGQTVNWTGFGVATDSFVYGASELDAIAHMGDAYFERIMDDTAALVVSLRTTDGPGPSIDPFFGGVPASMFYKNSSAFGGSTGVWATAPMINPVAAPTQISGIELHGSASDTTHWSEFGDPGGVSISTAAGPYLLNLEIGTAIGATVGFDVDAFMVLDHALSTELFHVGDYALMSVRGNSEFDGGEIWLLSRAAGGVLSASFLTHGGVTWDTANDVSGMFGFPAGFAEDVDGIEAIIPAPGMPVILAMTMFGAGVRRRRGENRS
jgi:hypothetical protein